MIFNFMAKKKSGLVPPTLYYCGHNANKIGPKKSLLKICTLHSVIGHLSAPLKVRARVTVKQKQLIANL